MADRMFDEYETERALLKVADGDSSGLTVLYEKLGKKVFSLAFSILSDRSAAEDATQETFYKILRFAGNYRKGESASAWITSIARNTAIDMVRKKRGVSADEDAIEAVPEEGDFTEALAVNELLGTLDETDRDIVILKAVDGFRFKEIGKIVGLTPGAAQKRYRRALKQLRPVFE